MNPYESPAAVEDVPVWQLRIEHELRELGKACLFAICMTPVAFGMIWLTEFSPLAPHLNQLRVRFQKQVGLIQWGNPSQDVRREHYHVIEANTVFNKTCEEDRFPLQYKPQFAQILFRRWEDSTGQFEIHAWRMLKGYPVEEREDLTGLPEEIAAELAKQPLRARTSMSVERNAAGKYEMRWMDGEVLRIITADSFVRTQTVGDVEVEERSRFDKSLRRELRRK